MHEIGILVQPGAADAHQQDQHADDARPNAWAVAGTSVLPRFARRVVVPFGSVGQGTRGPGFRRIGVAEAAAGTGREGADGAGDGCACPNRGVGRAAVPDWLQGGVVAGEASDGADLPMRGPPEAVSLALREAVPAGWRRAAPGQPDPARFAPSRSARLPIGVRWTIRDRPKWGQPKWGQPEWGQPEWGWIEREGAEPGRLSAARHLFDQESSQ